MSAALRVEDLHVRYRTKSGGQAEAVRGLSFEVAPGEVVGFLGPNGAGKSSTLKAIMGFVFPDKGSTEVFGLASNSMKGKQQIGYLPEVALYYPFLTPMETLMFYGQLQGIEKASLKKEAAELLDRVGLSQALTKQNRQLSKGMLQRVGIAQSLLGNPPLLVLDEVTSGLDPLGRRELRELLMEKQKEGTTLFFSSHELAEVEMLCDRILVIHKGQLVDERLVPELKAELRQHRVHLGGKTNLLGLTEALFPQPDGSVVAEFSDKSGLLAALERAQEAGDSVRDVIAQEGNLEDYFTDLISGVAA